MVTAVPGIPRSLARNSGSDSPAASMSPTSGIENCPLASIGALRCSPGAPATLTSSTSPRSTTYPAAWAGMANNRLNRMTTKTRIYLSKALCLPRTGARVSAVNCRGKTTGRELPGIDP